MIPEAVARSPLPDRREPPAAIRVREVERLAEMEELMAERMSRRAGVAVPAVGQGAALGAQALLVPAVFPSRQEAWPAAPPAAAGPVG